VTSPAQLSLKLVVSGRILSDLVDAEGPKAIKVLSKHVPQLTNSLSIDIISGLSNI
jgi:hypothetical protein